MCKTQGWWKHGKDKKRSINEIYFTLLQTKMYFIILLEHCFYIRIELISNKQKQRPYIKLFTTKLITNDCSTYFKFYLIVEKWKNIQKHPLILFNNSPIPDIVISLLNKFNVNCGTNVRGLSSYNLKFCSSVS